MREGKEEEKCVRVRLIDEAERKRKKKNLRDEDRESWRYSRIHDSIRT